MDKERLRSLFNFSALGLFILYFIGTALTLLIGTFNKRLDNDFVFAFSLNFIAWGGVIVLISILTIMITKLFILKE